MARTASGAEHVQAAKQLLRTAKTPEQLRQAQAVVLPLELGLSLEQTAAAVGRSRGATCTMRTRFMAVREGRHQAPRSKRDLRNRAKASLQQEASVLDEVMCTACLRATAGASLPLTRSTLKGMPRCVRTGKKLPGTLEQIAAGFERQAPLRVMFEDEATFGRINDCRRCWCRFPQRPLVRRQSP